MSPTFQTLLNRTLPSTVDYQFNNIAQAIMDHGSKESDPDRCSDDFTSLIGTSIVLENTAMAFPLLLSKKVFTDSIVKELLWFLRGETNIKTLGCGIWDEWAGEDGECGPIYGAQWRKRVDTQVIFTGDVVQYERGIRLMEAGYECIGSYPAGESTYDCNVLQKKFDQLGDVIKALRAGSKSRRLIVDCWDVGNLDQMALPPCHYTFQFHNKEANKYHKSCMNASIGKSFDRTLHLTVTMRSNDTFLGKPFNIASYTLLLHTVAKMCKMNIGTFVLNVGDDHIYEHHFEPMTQLCNQYNELISECLAERKLPQYPRLILADCVEDFEDISELKEEHISIQGYNPKPAIRARVTK